MGTYRKTTYWREKLLGYIKGDTDEVKQDVLRGIEDIVESTVKANKRKAFSIVIGLVLVLILLFLLIWNLPDQSQSILRKADFSNGLIAIILAVWTFLKIKPKPIDEEAINTILSFKITPDVLKSINEEVSKNTIPLDRYVPLVCAIFIFLTLCLKLFL